MAYKPVPQPAEEKDHDCPKDCLRMIRTLYVNCEEEAISKQLVDDLGTCPIDTHSFQALAMEIDGRPAQRCLKCGCWKW